METGVKWIDGKTIYKKTVSVGAWPNSTTKRVPHGIANFYRAIKIEGYGWNPVSTQAYTVPYTPVAPVSLMSINVNATDIILTTEDDRSGISESYITIYCTKTGQ